MITGPWAHGMSNRFVCPPPDHCPGSRSTTFFWNFYTSTWQRLCRMLHHFRSTPTNQSSTRMTSGVFSSAIACPGLLAVPGAKPVLARFPITSSPLNSAPQACNTIQGQWDVQSAPAPRIHDCCRTSQKQHSPPSYSARSPSTTSKVSPYFCTSLSPSIMQYACPVMV